MGRDRRLARAFGAAAATFAAGALLVGLAVAPAQDAAPAPAARTYDTGFSTSGAVVTPVYKTVAIRRCSAWRYNATTRVTTCVTYKLGTTYVRFLGLSNVAQRNRAGTFVRIPYVWSSSARALVYNHWLYLQLHKPVAPAPTASPTASASPSVSPSPSASTSPSTSPSGSASPSDSASPSVSATGPTPTITARTIPMPAGTGLSPTPTSTIAGEGAAKSGSYTWMSGTTAQNAVRWDKCLPITWSVDLTNATKAGTTAADELARWQQAVDFASRVTGYTFQYVPGGTGKVTMDPGGTQVVSTAWTATGAKLVITYVSTTDTGAYRSTAVTGGTIGYTYDSWFVYGTNLNLMAKSSIQLEYDWLTTASETDRYNLIFHEFGHALGLSHVEDTSQVMNPYISSQDLLRLGDRTGLWQLAQQPCR
jgi:hypothetical protein